MTLKMRVAVISDIHGNLRAFRAVLADLRHTSPDLIVHGGDLSSGGTRPAEIVDEIRGLGWSGVQGNTDEMLHTPLSFDNFAAANTTIAQILAKVRDTIAPTATALGEKRLQWLKSLPTQYTTEEFTLVHASPGDLWRAPMPNASDDGLRRIYAPLHAKVVVYAHIHQPFIRQLPELTIINTGSVSQSYDGDTRASYLLIDDGNFTIRRVAYDVEAEANDLSKSPLPHADWLARILLTGRFVPPE